VGTVADTVLVTLQRRELVLAGAAAVDLACAVLAAAVRMAARRGAC
jgi:hypothetical protein